MPEDPKYKDTVFGGPWVRTIWLLVVTVFVVLSLIRQTEIITKNCEQIELVKSGLRGTLLEAERFAQTSPVRSKQERELIVQFYSDALGREKPRNC